MPRSIETENITVAMPVDLLDLLDDLCIRKDLHRTQTVVRAIKVGKQPPDLTAGEFNRRE